MKIALVLTHRFTDQENFDQIEVLKPLVKIITKNIQVVRGDEKGDPVLDQDGEPILDTYTVTDHYELNGLSLPHEVKFYQIVPFGVTPPSNLNNIDSHKVFYGKGDEDKIGDHPRFFNWGLKRSTDYGADIVLNVEDINKLNLDDLAIQLNTLVDPQDKREYIDDESVKIATLKLLKEVGQLDETKTREEALEEYKTKTTDKGFEVEEVKKRG